MAGGKRRNTLTGLFGKILGKSSSGESDDSASEKRPNIISSKGSAPKGKTSRDDWMPAPTDKTEDLIAMIRRAREQGIGQVDPVPDPESQSSASGQDTQYVFRETLPEVEDGPAVLQKSAPAPALPATAPIPAPPIPRSTLPEYRPTPGMPEPAPIPEHLKVQPEHVPQANVVEDGQGDQDEIVVEIPSTPTAPAAELIPELHNGVYSNGAIPLPMVEKIMLEPEFVEPVVHPGKKVDLTDSLEQRTEESGQESLVSAAVPEVLSADDIVAEITDELDSETAAKAKLEYWIPPGVPKKVVVMADYSQRMQMKEREVTNDSIKLLCHMLPRFGYTPVMCENEVDAVELCKQKGVVGFIAELRYTETKIGNKKLTNGVRAIRNVLHVQKYGDIFPNMLFYLHAEDKSYFERRKEEIDLLEKEGFVTSIPSSSLDASDIAHTLDKMLKR